MAERIPRPIIPRTAISVSPVGNIKVQNSRLDAIPRPVTSRLEPPKIRTALPPVTTNLRPPTVRTPELEILEYEPPIVRPSVNPGLGGGFPSQQNQNQEEAEDTRSLPPPPPMPVPVKPDQPVITLPYIGELPIPPYETVVLSGTTTVGNVMETITKDPEPQIAPRVDTKPVESSSPVAKQEEDDTSDSPFD